MYIVGNADNMQETLYCKDYGLRWTTEPPTREGWYWAIDKDSESIDLEKVFQADHGGGNEPLEVWVDQYESMQLSDFTHWLGPLPVPEPPSEGE